MPAFTVRHGRVHRAPKRMAGVAHRREEFRGLVHGLLGVGGVVDHQVEFIQLLPHLRGNDFPHRAGVLARRTQTGKDRVGIARVESQEPDHVFARGHRMFGGKEFLVARGVDHRLPLFLDAHRQIQHQAQVDVHKPRHILRALDVAAHPINGIRDATEHQWIPSASLPPPLDNTQVSLLPPPWDEFTTSEPFLSATRVRPPGST